MRVSKLHSHVIVQQQRPNELTSVTNDLIRLFLIGKKLHQIFAQTILDKCLPIGLVHLASCIDQSKQATEQTRLRAQGLFVKFEVLFGEHVGLLSDVGAECVEQRIDKLFVAGVQVHVVEEAGEGFDNTWL
ncbi:hypothetical protein BpHYR1_045183 [Brachionus plicatilis]|uniref:Uncharacterized protein n=1 Tax=Brachionus plicatilis TaxID=10195 RepID=A0A3M7SCK1_BRAPC|nr:hypothetical protein BpHYR1_045183 [Brachionus plicatilis]